MRGEEDATSTLKSSSCRVKHSSSGIWTSSSWQPQSQSVSMFVKEHMSPNSGPNWGQRLRRRRRLLPLLLLLLLLLPPLLPLLLLLRLLLLPLLLLYYYYYYYYYYYDDCDYYYCYCYYYYYCIVISIIIMIIITARFLARTSVAWWYRCQSNQAGLGR